MKTLFLARILASAIALAATLSAHGAVARRDVLPSAATTPTPIPKGPVYVQLTPVATGLTAPGAIVSANDGSGRLFIVELTGKVLILKNGAIAATPFLDVSGRLVAINPGYDERGLLGFTFHPDFNNPTAPGYRKIYTYTSEPSAGAADFTVPISGSFNHQSVVAEWQVSSANPDVIDPATRREIMRIDEPQSNHNAGDIHFRAADGYLYVALGDGGNGNDVGPGHTAGTGNGQDRSNVLGKILRIDPLMPSLTSGSADPISANGKYRVPVSNPFVGQSGPVAEIYSYGFRNPYRFSFDANANQLLIGDVGQNNIEEVDLGVAGANYGWNRKEGTFLFNSSNGSISDDPSPDPALTNPLTEYTHADGSAVIGGFVYRGALLPALSGQYIFGDLAASNGGRLFYADTGSGLTRELRLGANDAPLGLYLKGFGQDNHGEVYVVADTTSGPSGTGGIISKLTTIPPATAVSRMMHDSAAFDLDLLAGKPAIESRRGTTPGNYEIILGFPSAISFSGAMVTPGNGGTAAISGTPVLNPAATQVTIELTNVSDAQTLTVTLTGVNNGSITRDVSVQMGVLIGDSNGDGSVNSGDALQTRNRSGQSTDASNFRSDVNADGTINSGDAFVVRARSGATLPQ
ncbi:MAG: PQQ-dependent sugar dehydrogenase [Verrucomicrobiota bacterium]|nr:PQQ-dependent sugar dehydrogenase [Verrucomicrobiota bacterium]